MNIVIFKPKIDSRFSAEHIVSHNQLKMRSHVISDTKEILKISKSNEVVGIDEAQFFDQSIVMICKQLAGEGKRVIVAGLDTDIEVCHLAPCQR